jgi:hypothetical protein
MASHEKHQYFYEKYLRNEMPDNERHQFEEKLSVDESFKRSFYHYKTNRKEFLENLLLEDKVEAEKRWNLNSLVYLMISVTGIVLAINYYAFKDEDIHPYKIKNNTTWNFFKHIPFLTKKPDEPKHSIPKIIIHQMDSSKQLIQDESLHIDEETNREEAGIASDVMELDSFVVAYEKNYYELRFKTIKDETDSMIVDSMMQILAAKSAGRNAQLSKPMMVYVEFWKSPVNYKGYKFNGKKLVIYGISSPYEIYLLRDDDDFIFRTTKNEFVLIKDNNFHKF